MPAHEIRTQTYENETLKLIEVEFTSNGEEFIYPLPPTAEGSIVAVLVEGTTAQETSLPGYLPWITGLDHMEDNQQVFGEPMLGEYGGGGPPMQQAVASFTAGPSQLLLPSPLALAPEVPAIHLRAPEGIPIKLTILFRHVGDQVMKWFQSCKGCKKLVSFLLRASMTALGHPPLPWDHLIHGALAAVSEALAHALEQGAGHFSGPIGHLIEHFHPDIVRKISKALERFLNGVFRPYDRLLDFICQRLGYCP